jgi:peptide-methionine (S)-S-oxide reductase
MPKSPLHPLFLALSLAALASLPASAVRAAPALLPPSVPGTAFTVDTAVFAGGCFWGIEGVFEHIKGVVSPTYEDVSSEETGHAESVQVVYEPSKISYNQLLQVFFTVAHDPTQLNRQGPDVGTSYRSAIFFRSAAQQKAATDYVAELTRKKLYGRPIVTQIVPLKAFYRAEDYHQHYMALHPDQPYIVYNDAPKVERLRKEFPALYQES